MVESPSIRIVGIADLILLKQTRVRFVPAEVAHITNVVAGESNERTHRRLNRREETIQVDTIREEETERDLQTSEKFELQRESQQTVSQELELQAALSVSAQYGPFVKAETNLGVRSLSTTERTDKTSTKYAREITQRSVERIKTRVAEARILRTVEEVEEKNIHTLSNQSPADKSAVYQWVDKVYEVQLENYGRRLMIEAIVPAPGAQLRQFGSSPPGLTISEPPSFDITADDITEATYVGLASKWRATDLPMPPPEKVAVSVSLNFAAKSAGQSLAEKTHVRIPDGYSARWWRAKASFTEAVVAPRTALAEGGYVKVAVGTEFGDLLQASTYDSVPSLGEQFMSGFGSLQSAERHGDLPVSVTVKNASAAIAVNVNVGCERDNALFQRWQLQVFQTLYEAYTDLQSRYDEQVAAARSQGNPVVGYSPVMNRQIERTELRRLVIELLLGHVLNDTGGRGVYSSDGLPTINLAANDLQAVRLSFFESDFEWDRISYELFPYYWDGRNTWFDAQRVNAPDPLHDAFLKAGAARVLVPVVPGRELRVLHFFAADRDIWTASEPPPVPDLYRTLVADLQSAVDGNLSETSPVTVGSPWEIRLPTELVVLDSAALPSGWVALV